MTSKRLSKRVKPAGYVRYGLTKEELQVLDAAAAMDEHSRAAFARIYALRAARAIIAQYGTYDGIKELAKYLNEEKD